MPTYLLCYLRLQARSHMLPTVKDVWSGCAPTALLLFALNYSTCGFHLKLMFHSSGNCQSLISALKSLQIPSVTLTKCIDAFKWNIWNENMYFLTGGTNFRVFKAPLFIPYSSWNLWQWHVPEIMGAVQDRSRCPAHRWVPELHIPPFFPISPPSSRTSTTPCW